MQSSKQIAQQLMAKNYNVVPLNPKSKATYDTNWQRKNYSVDNIDDNANLGLNLGTSNLADVDLDSANAIHFGKKYLPHNTLILGREYPDGLKQLTHFFFRNDGMLKDNLVRSFNDETIAEIRVSGQTVVYGPTQDKLNPSVYIERYWANEYEPKYNNDIVSLFNKVCFAAAIATFKVGGNLGALKLDACIMRYTDWSDEVRASFLLDIISITEPNTRDCNIKKMQRHVKANNQEKKNAGYISFASHIGADPKKIKELFSWIGDIPSSDNHEKTLSIADFNDVSLDMNHLMEQELPPMLYAVNPILPEGFVCMAGRPKAMKSWTALKISYDVQNGKDFLGHKTIQGDCLYFALEDSKRRVKDRVQKIRYNYKGVKHPQIVLSNNVPYLTYGFETCVENLRMRVLLTIKTISC